MSVLNVTMSNAAGVERGMDTIAEAVTMGRCPMPEMTTPPGRRG